MLEKINMGGSNNEKDKKDISSSTFICSNTKY